MAKLAGNAVANPWLAVSSKAPVTYADLIWDEQYDKGQGLYKTQAEINKDLYDRLSQAVAGGLQKSVVEELPGSGEENVIYLVPSTDPQAQNARDEYMWISGAWEKIGSTATDISGLLSYAEDQSLNTTQKQQGLKNLGLNVALIGAELLGTTLESPTDATVQGASALVITGSDYGTLLLPLAKADSTTVVFAGLQDKSHVYTVTYTIASKNLSSVEVGAIVDTEAIHKSGNSLSAEEKKALLGELGAASQEDLAAIKTTVILNVGANEGGAALLGQLSSGELSNIFVKDGSNYYAVTDITASAESATLATAAYSSSAEKLVQKAYTLASDGAVSAADKDILTDLATKTYVDGAIGDAIEAAGAITGATINGTEVPSSAGKIQFTLSDEDGSDSNTIPSQVGAKAIATTVATTIATEKASEAIEALKGEKLWVASATMNDVDLGVAAGVMNIPTVTSVRTEGAVDTRLTTEKAVADAIVAALAGYGVQSIKVAGPLLSTANEDGVETITSALTVELDGSNHLKVTGASGQSIADIDMSKFVIDGMLDSVELVTDPEDQDPGTYLHFTWNASAGSKEMYIDVTKLLDNINYTLTGSAVDVDKLIETSTSSEGATRTMDIKLGVMTTYAQYTGTTDDRFVTVKGLKDVIANLHISEPPITSGKLSTGTSLNIEDKALVIPVVTAVRDSGADDLALPTEKAVDDAIKKAVAAIPTYEEATQSKAGLMSAADKTKLDGIATGATADEALSEEEITAVIGAVEY